MAMAWGMKARVKEVVEEGMKAGKEDPRKVVHSIKAGMALTIASLLYLLEPLYDGIGQNSLWAILTVILVLEFTAGATLYKGINRGLGTVAAIGLAFLIEIFASHIGHTGRAVCIAFAVFFIGSLGTYVRFIPVMKNHYDYGLVVFLVTFNLIVVGSYHTDNVLQTMAQRVYTIGIGCAICLITCILIFPNWSGEDLQSSIISKFEELSKLMQACVNEYFQEADAKATDTTSNSAPQSEAYEKTLECKTMDDLAKFASWEPRHSRYCYPWKQYVHLGVVLRHLGYTAAALHGCLESHIQAPKSVRALFREPCEHVAEEVVKVLRELADTIKAHHHVSPHISDHLHEALEELDTSIKSQPKLFLTSNPIQGNETFKSIEPPVSWQCKRPLQVKDFFGKNMNRTTSKTVITCLEFSDALPFAAFVSLLVETVARLDVVIEEVEELGKVAHFKDFQEEELELVVTSKENKLNEDMEESKDAPKLEMCVDNAAKNALKEDSPSASRCKESHKDDITIVINGEKVYLNKTLKDSISTLNTKIL